MASISQDTEVKIEETGIEELKKEEAKLKSAYDVTRRVKQILVAANDGKAGHPLIIDGENKNESIFSYFLRGARYVIGEKVLNRKTLSLEAFNEDAQEDDIEKVKVIFVQALASASINSDAMKILDYNLQSFLSISANRILGTVLGRDLGVYRAGFSNGKVCHFWSEENRLCILIVDDGFSVICDADPDEKYYLPGAMLIELKVPFSVINNKETITEEYITRALVTSEELFNLLHFNPDLISLLDNDSISDWIFFSDRDSREMKQELIQSLRLFLIDKGRKESSFASLDNQIEAPNFKDMLPPVDIEAVELSSAQMEALRDSLCSPLMWNESGETSPHSEESSFSGSESGSDKMAPSDGLLIEPNTSSDSILNKNESEKSIEEFELKELYYQLPPRKEEKPKSDSGIHRRRNVFLLFRSESDQENSNPNQVVRTNSNLDLLDSTFTLKDIERSSTDKDRSNDHAPNLFFNKSF